MGLFDIVHCKKPLPDGRVADELQTKDFENPYMEHYTIEDDGRLYKEPVRHSRNVRRDMNYHGWLRLTSRDSTYAAKFTNGILETITQVDE